MKNWLNLSEFQLPYSTSILASEIHEAKALASEQLASDLTRLFHRQAVRTEAKECQNMLSNPGGNPARHLL